VLKRTAKLVAATIVAATLPFTLAACAKGGTSTNAATPGGTQTLSMWTHNAGNKTELAAIQAIVTDYNASQTKYKVDLQAFPQDSYNQSVVAAAAAKKLPCILDMDGPNVPNWAWAGYLAPLDGMDETLSKFLPTVLGKWNGKTYSYGYYDVALNFTTRKSTPMLMPVRGSGTHHLSPRPDISRAGECAPAPCSHREEAMRDNPDLERFDHDDAWLLGTALVVQCRERELPVTIAIHLGEQRVFHAALPGTSADNDRWVERKTHIVQRFGIASAEVAERYVADGDFSGFLTAFALSPERYFPAGGAVPIRVRGSLVGVLAISGLESTEDHDLAVSVLTSLATEGGHA